MADSKITALAALTAADPVNDMFPVVDVSDTSMAASGTTKRISANNILSSSPTASGALTVTGLVTAGSATITGAATVGTTLGVTGKSTLTGNVAIGTTSSPWLAGLSALDISSNGLCAYSGGITHNAYYDNTDSRWEYKANGAATFYNPQNGIHQWFVAASGTANSPITTFATAAMELTATGNLAFPTGKGIDFSATAGTGTSELLNDYEEGTWTGTLRGAIDPTIAVTATGRYTKVGQVVTVQIAFELVTNTGASGAISISGLPFTNNASVRAIGTGGVFSGATFTGTMIVEIGVSGTSIAYYGINSNSAWSSADHNAGAGRYFWANVTYTV